MNFPKLDVRQDASAIERLERVKHGTRLLHAAIEPLWEELNEPDGLRALAVRGFANIVRQHAIAQWVLVQHELDISATALVRRSEEHKSELQSLMRISYAVLFLKKKNIQ